MIRKFIIAWLFLLPLACYSLDVEKPIQVIIPFPPGGSVDVTFRHIQKYAEKQKLNLIPVYRPGAEGVIALDRLSSSCTDGRCIGLTPLASIAQHRLQSPALSENITVLTNIKTQPNSFIINNTANARTVKDVIHRMNSGHVFKIGQGSPGSRIAAEQFLSLINSKTGAIVVPYKGAAPMIQDVLGNNIEIAVAPFTITKPHVDAKRVNLLMLTSSVKFSSYDTTYVFDVFPTWKNFEGHIIVYPKMMDKRSIVFWNNFFQNYLQDGETIAQHQKEYNITSKFGDVKNINLLVEDVKKKLE